MDSNAAKFSNSSASSNNGKLGWLNAKSLSKEIMIFLKRWTLVLYLNQ